VKGSCHCGAVRFAVSGEVRRGSVCHCSQCRKQSGGAWASATIAAGDLSTEGEVRWFKASDKARRGFCPTCGAFLFWEAEGSGEIAFALGAVDGPTGLHDLRHIFVPGTPPSPEGTFRSACLCGAVTVEFDGGPGEVTACHCTQCRKVSGHVPLTIDDPDRRVRVEGEVATFTSPGGAVRSFCPTCGTKIAFDGPEGLLSVEMGLFDQLAGREPDLHIFTAFKGDYYDLPGGVPAYPESGPD
jgi:hypothetical protein